MSKVTTSNQGDRLMTITWGKLEFFPTRKGDEVYLNNADFLAVLRQYDGKEIHITIQEMGFDSTYHSFDKTANEEVTE